MKWQFGQQPASRAAGYRWDYGEAVGLLGNTVESLDRRLGDGLEALLSRHHSRRLRRLGWRGVLSPPSSPLSSRSSPLQSRSSPLQSQQPRPGGLVDYTWAVGAAVRPGNSVEVLIDGLEVLPAVVDAVMAARSHVLIAGWHASPDFHMRPEGPTLRELLASAAERVPVRVLMWAGPPLPLFEPTRRMAKAACEGLSEGTGVRAVLDARERTMHCHHEKIVVVDDEVAFVGGIDFTDLQGDRLDSRAHPPASDLGWHDAAMRLRGPIVADAAHHVVQRWNEITGDGLPEPAVPRPAGSTTAQFVRTVPERTYAFAPRGEFTILDGYLRALRAARSLIYLENQFLWSPEIVDVLVDKLRNPPQDRFRLVLVLPRRPSNGADTTRGQLGRLVEADDDAGRLVATTIDAHDGNTSVPVYVHAKIGIVDDAWMTIGSANLNEHSLFNDTEANVIVRDGELIRGTRLRLWAEHLQRPEAEIAGDPADVVDSRWRPIAQEQAHREKAGEPRTHRLTLLPGVSRRAERLNGPLRGLLVDG